MNHKLNKYALRTAFCAKDTTNYKARSNQPSSKYTKKTCPPNILITIPGSTKSVGKHRTGIIVYIECQSVCPFFGNGSSQPLVRKQVYLPRPWTQREGNNTRLRVRGWGDPILTTGQKVWHSVYSLVYIVESLYVRACWGRKLLKLGMN